MKKIIFCFFLSINFCFSQNIIISDHDHGTTVLDLKLAGLDQIYETDELVSGDFFAGDTKQYLKSTLEPANGCEIRSVYDGIRIKFCYLNGKAIGFLGIREWHANGEISSEASFDGNLILTTGWYDTGELECKIYKDPHGWRTGKCLWFYKNGKISTEQNWEPLPNDPHMRNGLWKNYYESGQLKYEFRYKNGKEHGTSKVWFENGQLQKESIYKDGKVMTYSFGYKHEKCWDENGNKIECE